MAPTKSDYDYGFSTAFLNANPSVKALVGKAVGGNWSIERFQNALRDTSWWKSSQESIRQWQLRLAQDPASVKAEIGSRSEELEQRAKAMGAVLSANQLSRLAQESLKFGWNEQQLAGALVNYIDFSRRDRGGMAAELQGKYKELARLNGVTLPKNWQADRAREVLGGNTTDEAVTQQLREMAASAFPAFAEQLRAGKNLQDVAAPYVGAMSQLLEINPEDIDFKDKTLRSALQSTGADGKPAAKPLYQFEKELRKDRRWLNTDNARESLASVSRQVLTDFGLGF